MRACPIVTPEVAGDVMSLVTLARELENEAHRVMAIGDMEKFIQSLSPRQVKVCLMINAYLVSMLADPNSLLDIGLKIGASENGQKVAIDPMPKGSQTP